MTWLLARVSGAYAGKIQGLLGFICGWPIGEKVCLEIYIALKVIAGSHFCSLARRKKTNEFCFCFSRTWDCGLLVCENGGETIASLYNTERIHFEICSTLYMYGWRENP